MNNSNNNQYNGPKNECPCGNTINSPQHDRCVHCAKDIEDYEDLTWDEFWADWDDTMEEF